MMSRRTFTRNGLHLAFHWDFWSIMCSTIFQFHTFPDVKMHDLSESALKNCASDICISEKYVFIAPERNESCSTSSSRIVKERKMSGVVNNPSSSIFSFFEWLWEPIACTIFLKGTTYDFQRDFSRNMCSTILKFHSILDVKFHEFSESAFKKCASDILVPENSLKNDLVCWISCSTSSLSFLKERKLFADVENPQNQIFIRIGLRTHPLHLPDSWNCTRRYRSIIDFFEVNQ